MKPVIFYVDDEPHNLTVFEATVGDNFAIYTYDSPIKALEDIENHKPWVIVSDQRMPSMSGVSFLEFTKKIVPEAVRIIVTGYSDENLVVESVRKAQVFDYIRKPWEPQEIEHSIAKAIEFYRANEEAKKLTIELKKREEELKEQTLNLLRATHELEAANKREYEMRKEIECWVPPFVLWSLQDKHIKFPIKRDIVGVTFDIVNSAEIHDKIVEGRSLRSLVIQAFSEAIIRHGGWRESHTGDSAYGHFGLLDDKSNPYEAALAVAREFRVSLRGLASVHQVNIECGIALHVAREAIVDVHTVQLNTPRGVITQKSFDTTSSDIDLLHRIEKVTHDLPGTNIILTKAFVEGLRERPMGLLDLGSFDFKGQKKSVELLLIRSDKINDSDIPLLLAKTRKSA